MKIVYLIGNGFDLNLGMKTSYRDFYEYYIKLPTDYDADIVKRLKREIRDNVKNWSDFELSLGEFLDEKVASQDAITLHKHLIEYLQKYLEMEENKYIFDNVQKKLLGDYLSYPYLNAKLSPRELTRITGTMSEWKDNLWDVKIITFNYTRSIEKLLDSDINQKIFIGWHHADCGIYLSAIEHVHGFTDERMILGVNDISQIKNSKLLIDTDVVDSYVKSNCNNNVYESDHDTMCQQWIKEANLICLFGLSFGDTDKRWWNAVGDVLQNGSIVIIFEHIAGNVPNGNQGLDKRNLKRHFKNKFLSKTNVGEDSKEGVKDNLYIAFSKDMFKFGKLKESIETDSESV